MRSNRYRLTSSQPQGFTLVELMITLVVLAILVAIAAPNFREVSLNSRSSGNINTLVADLSMARSEAVKHARTVTVAADPGGWSSGWQVFLDVRSTGTLVPGDGDQLIKIGEPVNPDNAAEGNRFRLRAVTGTTGAGAALNEITFGASGQSRVPAAGARFALCRPDDDAEKSIGVRIDVSGRVQSVKDLNGLGLSCPS